MTITLRALGTDDIPAHAALLAASEEADRTGEHYDAADLAEEYANPDIELGRDIVGAFDGTGEGAALLGYFSVYPRSQDGTHQKVHLEGTVHPDRRGEGIGTTLVAAMVERADAVHAERHPDLPARFHASGLATLDEQVDLLATVGLVPHRWSFVMRAQLGVLDLPDAPPVPPDGLALTTYSPERDAALRAAHNEVFLDHPGFTPWTETMWTQWVSGSHSFRPELSLLVVDPAEPERVLAYLQTNEYDAHAAATGRREGYVAKVGTRRELRGRGLASLLLTEALRRYREAGLDEASLGVDSANPTGALGVYERAGFEVESRWNDYVLERPALG